MGNFQMAADDLRVVLREEPQNLTAIVSDSFTCPIGVTVIVLNDNEKQTEAAVHVVSLIIAKSE